MKKSEVNYFGFLILELSYIFSWRARKQYLIYVINVFIYLTDRLPVINLSLKLSFSLEKQIFFFPPIWEQKDSELLQQS